MNVQKYDFGKKKNVWLWEKRFSEKFVFQLWEKYVDAPTRTLKYDDVLFVLLKTHELIHSNQARQT
jgi:hypothetical protein